MRIEQQVCTKDQAHKLKELGIRQDSFFAYISEGELLSRHSPNLNLMAIATDFVAAYSVAELSQMLPDYYPSWRFPVHTGGPLKWVATVICWPKPQGIDDIHTASEFDRIGDTQAEALANLLIALLETEVITPEEVNQRLSQNL